MIVSDRMTFYSGNARGESGAWLGGINAVIHPNNIVEVITSECKLWPHYQLVGWAGDQPILRRFDNKFAGG